MTLKEEIAEFLYQYRYCADWKILSEEQRQKWLEQSTDILSLIRKKVEAIENPYKKSPFMTHCRTGFESARQSILEILK
jgi:hypothetical protein